jgi:hypothetical protein
MIVETGVKRRSRGTQLEAAVTAATPKRAKEKS